MRTVFFLIATLLFFDAFSQKTIYDFTVKNIDGKNVSLNDYKGKVVVIVNVASKCGLTPQYESLQAFYEKYKGKGVVVLGFPANNFMGQEPGTEAEIKDFCSTKYNVTFPMFSKISVKGKDIAPLYSYLTQKKENGVFDAGVKWNFQKFIVDKSGKVIQYFSPNAKVTDDAFLKAVEYALQTK